MNWQIATVIVGIISLLMSGIIMVFGWQISNKILNNDLKHLAINVERILQRQDKQGETLDDFENRVSKLEGKLEK